jgi:hypothetical protein
LRDDRQNGFGQNRLLAALVGLHPALSRWELLYGPHERFVKTAAGASRRQGEPIHARPVAGEIGLSGVSDRSQRCSEAGVGDQTHEPAAKGGFETNSRGKENGKIMEVKMIETLQGPAMEGPLLTEI